MAGTNWASADACRKRRLHPRHQGLALLLSLALLWGPASASITFYLTYITEERAALDCVAAAGGSVTYNIPQDNIILGACPDDACYENVALCGSALDTTGVIMMGPNITQAGPELQANAEAGPASSPIPSLQPAGAVFGCYQWGPAATKAPAAWAAGVTGEGARIAILDQPLHCAHLDIGLGPYAQLVDIQAGASFVNVGPCQTAAVSSHGTHVAGIAAGRGVATLGVAPRATIIPVAVLGLNGGGSFGGIIAGIYHAVITAKADILNLSLGGTWTREDRKEVNDIFAQQLWVPMVRAVNFANRNGALVVVAAGNDQLDMDTLGSGRNFLSSLPNVIGVSATGPPGTWCPPITCIGNGFGCSTNDAPLRTPLPEPPSSMRVPAQYTNYGRGVDLAAPGGTFQGYPGPEYDWLTTQILSPTTYAGGVHYYWYASGTSMAAPHVAGAAALLLSKYPGLKGNPAQLKARLMKGAERNKQYKEYYGSGFLNVAASLGLA
jgi:subtilisin family serine protease